MSDKITKDGVTISTTLQSCEDKINGTAKEYVLITVLNENTYAVNLSFKRNTWYNGKCVSCDSSSPENIVELTIDPNGKVEGNCNESNGLRIFSQMLHLKKVRKLTHYELVDIQVNAL